MKLIFAFFLFFSFLSQGQNFVIREIKLKPKSSIYKTDKPTIIYPVIEAKNKSAGKLINDAIKKEVLSPEDNRQSLYSCLKENINEYGLSDLYYEVTFNKKGILSINIFSEGCGAYCSSTTSYFNFDIHTGKEITIKDIFDLNGLDSLRKIVYHDKVKVLNKYKIEEQDELKNNYIDSADYNWIIKEIDSNCIKMLNIERFSLSNSEIVIQDECVFPSCNSIPTTCL